MDHKGPIPEDIQRFILRNIDSVPHLEALLLLRYDPKAEWDAKMMAQSLYIGEAKAAEVLADLCASGIAVVQNVAKAVYSYKPTSTELKLTLDRLAEVYAKNLIEVTNLIHSKTGKKAQEFGDAFRWQNEKE